MADPVTPQLRETVLERLRELTSTRNVPRSPEEIENLIMDRSNGIKKTYMSIVSQVVNSGPISGLGGTSGATNRDTSSSSPTVIPSNVRPVVSCTRAGPGLLQPQQQQPVGPSQPQQHQPVQVVHVTPLTSSSTATGTSSVITTHNLPPNRPRLQSSPNQTQSTIVNQAASSTGHVSMDQNGQRITIQPGVTTAMPNQIPPRVIFVKTRKGGKLLHRLVLLSSHVQSASDHPLPQRQTGSVVGPGASALTVSATLGGSVSQPVVVYSTPSGGQQQTTGSYTLSTSTGAAQFASNIQGAPVTAAHTGNYPTENYGGGSNPVTVLRPVESAATQNALQPALVTVPITSGASAGESATLLSPHSRNVRGSAGMTTTTVVSIAQQMIAPSSGSLSKPAVAAATGSTTSSSYRTSSQGSGSSHSKPPAKPLTLEMRAQIVSGLKQMAGRYLPAVRRAIQLVSEQPPPPQQQGVESSQSAPQSSSMFLRKYVKLKEILENPETNLAGIRPNQLPGIEKLLIEMERNPLHLVQPTDQSHRQQAQHHQSHQQQQQTQQQVGRFGSSQQPQRLTGDVQTRIASEQQVIAMQSQRISPQSQALPPGSGAVNRFRDSQEDVSHRMAVGQQQALQQRLVSGSASLGLGGAFFLSTGLPGPYDFANSLKALADDFKHLTSGVAHDESGGGQLRRLRRAISEIAVETKLFRESHGLMLAQDLLTHWSPARVTGSHQLTETADDKVIVDMGLHTVEGGESVQKGSPVAPSDEDVHREAASPTRKRQLSVAGGEGMADLLTEVAQPKGKRQRTASDWSLSCLQRQPPKTAVNKETPEFSKRLFLDSAGITDDPNADPLATFPADQLDRLNPRVVSEVDQIRRHLHLPVEVNSCPPPVDVMETYSTCIDYGEWNASCHLVIGGQTSEGGVVQTGEDQPLTAGLPCCPPPLFVRLSPDYLSPGTAGEAGHHLNWYYSPDWSPESGQTSALASLSDGERARFLQLCYLELNRTIGCRASTHHRPCHRYVSLYQLAKAWLDCLCAAMARFVKFDESVQAVFQAPGTVCTPPC